MTKAFAKMVLRMAFDTTTMYGSQAAATRAARARASAKSAGAAEPERGSTK
jgi:hypothetical protein